MSYNIHATVHERGIATGHSDVRTDTMTFRFKGETFTLPSLQAIRVAWWNGYFYEARIDDIRKLEAEACTPKN